MPDASDTLAAGGIRLDRDAVIPLRDGGRLSANVFRPDRPGRVPVLMVKGIYGKDVHFEDGYPLPWAKLVGLNPDIIDAGSSGHFLRWEMIDPERWVPDGYVVIAVDSRGSGKSPGYLDPFSPRETEDYREAIAWAAAQGWSSGRVGLIGISYYTIKHWQVAATRPPALAAICQWEGGCDLYRDWSHHGGILSDVFPTAWYPRQVLPNQNGNAATHHRDRDTGAPTTGDPVPGHLLPHNRADHPGDLLAHPFDDAWHGARTPDLGRIEVPLYSAGNWGGAGLHLRGNIEGYLRAGSERKWLEMHTGTHFESFYRPDCIARQKRFLDRHLKDADNGWDDTPPIRLEIRHPDHVEERFATAWPLPGTEWTRLYLDPAAGRLGDAPPPAPSVAQYQAREGGLTLRTAPFAAEVEFTGPVAARLWVSSETEDMDIFACLRLFDPEGREVVFQGASDLAPVARGWLRASHRALDPARSHPWRPWHRHDGRAPLIPGEAVAVDVEIWPTSIVCPPGYRLALTVQGHDLEVGDQPGRILHDHPADRPPRIFAARNAVHAGPGRESFLLMPRIPSARGVA